MRPLPCGNIPHTRQPVNEFPLTHDAPVRSAAELASALTRSEVVLRLAVNEHRPEEEAEEEEVATGDPQLRNQVWRRPTEAGPERY